MFKKIYVEITNICNLNCSFCPKHGREKKYMRLEDFNVLLKNVKDFTNYLYFHVMGEPLMHPQINEFIDLASKHFFVNLTTNGYLLKKIENNKNIRQINISLHSFDGRYGKTLDKYLGDIFEAAKKLVQNGTYINYRLWVDSKDKGKIIEALEKEYQIKIEEKHTIIRDSIFLDFEDAFMWPSLDNEYYSVEGTCLGTRDHIGILVDGTVVPCCLDNNGVIALGNIYKENLHAIINSENFLKMKNGFLHNQKVCALCRRCNFYGGE